MHNESLWRTIKRAILLLALLGLICAEMAACGSDSGGGSTNTPTPTAIPTPTPSPLPLPSPTPSPTPGLEDDASQWGIFYDGGSANASLNNVANPSLDGSALQISLSGGDPFTGIHAYINLPPDNAAHTFDLSLSFYFTNVTPIQALEFTMNQWVNNQRWEWAMQWQHIGDGTPQQGNPPNWRVWTGSGWQDSGVMQQLAVNAWHKFHLKGNIVNGQAHYISFACDDISVNLGRSFNRVYSTGDKLAVAVQLDGNNHEAPYDVYIDSVDFRWS
jgi:hypothetical protein